MPNYEVQLLIPEPSASHLLKWETIDMLTHERSNANAAKQLLQLKRHMWPERVFRLTEDGKEVKV